MSTAGWGVSAVWSCTIYSKIFSLKNMFQSLPLPHENLSYVDIPFVNDEECNIRYTEDDGSGGQIVIFPPMVKICL